MLKVVSSSKISFFCCLKTVYYMKPKTEKKQPLPALRCPIAASCTLGHSFGIFDFRLCHRQKRS